MPRVLACDDDPLIRRLLTEALEYAGYEVVAATDGADAINKIGVDHKFDAVITDYNMPRANGIDVISHVQRTDATLPCIIVTAFRDLDLAMRAMQAGAVGFVPKPFKSEHLITVIKRACERRALEAETVRLRLLTPMLERFTMVLANTLESKDLAMQRHSERLVDLADHIGKQLGFTEQERSWLRLGACLHDIGKVGVPELILSKPRGLTPAEFDLIKQHPTIGAAILEDVDTWEEVTLIVRHHHEHYDGGGYPAGLSGEAIPIGARIVSVVDAFDVMRSGRPYCAPRPIDQIVEELTTLSGRQFDPQVVAAFVSALDEDDSPIRSIMAQGTDHTQKASATVSGHWLLGEKQKTTRR